MSLRILLSLLVLSFAPVAPAAEQAVPFSAVADAVRARLQSQSAGLPGTLELDVLGRDEPLRLPAGRHEMRVGAVAGPWPRARVAVPVRHFVDAAPVRSQTVWVAVRWWADAEVYDRAFPAGTPVAALNHHSKRVDLAPYGPAYAQDSPPEHQRLRRPVRAGKPLTAADFEPMPDVLAGAELQVEVVRGAVRLSTSGRALADGFIGDDILVALAARRQPVVSTILSPKAVRVED